MYVIDPFTGEKIEIEISLLNDQDFKKLTKKRYFFDWKLERGFEIFKLIIKGQDEILGLVSIERIPQEWRIHIRLLTVSTENKGREKRYDRITGNLLTYISRIALNDYAELACVSLKPKGAIAQHYIDAYNMNITGATLSLEIIEIMELIKMYDDEN